MKTHHPFIRIVLLALLTASITTPAPSFAAAVVSRFNTDLEGWLILGDNSGTWQSTGGNTGGCLAVNDLAIGQLNYAAAPPRFLGNWSAVTPTDSLMFDVHLVQLNGTLITGDWIFRIAGPGGSARGIVPGAAPPLNTWYKYAIPLSEAQWVIESGTWAGILANVTSLRLLVEYVNGDEDVLVDNVRLTRAPVAVFMPCVYSDFDGTGLDDWSFEGTGTVSNQAVGDGNNDAFLQVVDNTSTPGYAFAPARFLGNWTQLSGTGRITVDLRVLSFAGTNNGSPQFIRLSGPGGMAHVSLAPGDLPTSDREWRTFTFALNPSEWTLDSGTWTGLMANVAEFRMDTDFFSGGGTVGFDNVGRLRYDCAPIDDNVVMRVTDVSRCGRYSLIGAQDVALNPVTHVLHGIVRDRSTRDGVYMLNGATPYAKLATYDRPAAILFDHDGDGYVTEDFSGNVYRFVGATSSLWASGFHDGDDDPFGMTLVPDGFTFGGVAVGDILVADRGNAGPDQVWAFSPDVAEGELLVVPDPGEVDWFDITPGPGGSLFMADAITFSSLPMISSTGVLGSLALGQLILGPYAIAWDPVDAYLYVAGSGLQSLYRVHPITGAVTLVADGFASLSQAGMAIDPASRRLWVTDRGNNRVYEFCLPGSPPTGVDDTPAAPGLGLRAYPNPFNPSVQIAFEIERAGDVSLEVFDVSGASVRELVDRNMPAGEHVIRWDGRDDGGRPAASGVYFARLRHGGATGTVRLVLLR